MDDATISPAPADSQAVGGQVARDSLQALVAQFSQRGAFVRELIQNSIDAGAGRVDVRIVGRDDHLVVTVADDGEGMTRETVEDRLLVLFASGKEDDATKIGKFGVGFVSLFAVAPSEVVIDTARHGEHLRLVFDARRDYVLAALDEPWEGTAVRLRIPARGEAAARMARELREAAHYWCRHARIEVWTEGVDANWGWPIEQVVYPFDVDAAVRFEHHDEHGRAVFGLSEDREPLVGYYKGGLTLLEAREATIAGVTFRLESRRLEHTIARDNIRRDVRFRRMISALGERAVAALQARLVAALKASDGASPGHDALLRATRSPAATLPESLACLRTASGRLLSVRMCKPGLFVRRGRVEILWSSGESPLTRALERAGYVVLLGPPDMHPDAPVVAELLGLRIAEAERVWVAPHELPATPLVHAAAAVAGGERCMLVRFGGLGHASSDRLGLRVRDLETDLHRIDDAPMPLGMLLINAEHPSFAALERMPPRLAGPLLLWAARRSAGDRSPAAASVVEALLAAGGAA